MKTKLLLILISSAFIISCGKFESTSSLVTGQNTDQACKQNACEAHLSWTGPATMADGSPLPAPVGYYIYWGTSSGVYTNKLDNGTATSAVVSGLAPGIYYFVVTAYLTTDITIESEHSVEVSAIRSADMQAREMRMVLGH